jgi:hypothetical protein
MLIINREGSKAHEARSAGPMWRLRQLIQPLKRAIHPYTIRFVAYHQPACGC